MRKHSKYYSSLYEYTLGENFLILCEKPLFEHSLAANSFKNIIYIDLFKKKKDFEIFLKMAYFLQR